MVIVMPGKKPSIDTNNTQTQASLRERLLDVASRILADEGAENLGIRRLTEAVGASTMVFYTNFGSKQGLMEALWIEGFERFYQMQQEVIKRDLSPLDQVLELMRIYRINALTNREYFSITFGGGIKADVMPQEVRKRSRRVLECLVQSVADAMQAGALAKADPLEVATNIWACGHGYCMLENAKFLTDRTSDALFENHIRTTIKSFQS